jgi:uncharacterized protein (DUF305 family)
MKRIIAASLILAGYLTACNNAGDTDQSTDTMTTTANPIDTATTASTTGMQSGMPFMDVMNNMMKQMHGMQPTGDPDHDFATMMKQHHQGAIDMSNIELQQGQDSTLKQRARKIIDDSQKDIRDLDSFLTGYQAKPANSEYAKKAMDLMMKGHSDSMMRMHSGHIDRQFAHTMHMHHKQGIDMSREYLKSAKQAAPRKVANNVMRENGDDNKVLKSWMDKNKADTTARTGM